MYDFLVGIVYLTVIGLVAAFALGCHNFGRPHLYRWLAVRLAARADAVEVMEVVYRQKVQEYSYRAGIAADESQPQGVRAYGPAEA